MNNWKSPFNEGSYCTVAPYPSHCSAKVAELFRSDDAKWKCLRYTLYITEKVCSPLYILHTFISRLAGRVFLSYLPATLRQYQLYARALNKWMAGGVARTYSQWTRRLAKQFFSHFLFFFILVPLSLLLLLSFPLPFEWLWNSGRLKAEKTKSASA